MQSCPSFLRTGHAHSLATLGRVWQLRVKLHSDSPQEKAPSKTEAAHVPTRPHTTPQPQPQLEAPARRPSTGEGTNCAAPMQWTAQHHGGSGS